MKVLCFSSNYYFIKVCDLLKLESVKIDKCRDVNDCEAVILVDENSCKICMGHDLLLAKNSDDFVKTKVAYYSYPAFIGFFITLIKPIKRKLYVKNNQSFRVRFDKLLEANLTRGERNRENAYQWTNKKWQISKEEANKRYNDLYNSLKTHGYSEKSPMIVMINRKFGVKDQILQGHHRIGICKEVGIKEVNICFWTAPISFKIFNLFVKKELKK